ncbi:hypothetical protein [Thermococcus nautili]|uniref:Uncharacterized protein n=1 Tax=Thermococcus nautili TaxID=195522 RepID=W8NRE2_9EURY|nr:hypothetical protein [Thermococcus nautili]AHL21697.1 hypothetical protein BD01_0066 [Thermococcus nautili]CAI1491987.1 conserved exported protein of unknown function [Thermococcus nautili]
MKRVLLAVFVVFLLTFLTSSFVPFQPSSSTRTLTSGEVIEALTSYSPDSICWTANVTNGLSEKSVYACMNFQNSSASWRITRDGREYAVVLNPETNDTFLRDLAFNSAWIEWNVLNFIRYVAQNGKLVNITRSDGIYHLTFQLNRTETVNAGPLENPYIITTKLSMRLVLSVDSNGRPLGGVFEQRTYTSAGGSEGLLTGNFTVLGEWH